MVEPMTLGVTLTSGVVAGALFIGGLIRKLLQDRRCDCESNCCHGACRMSIKRMLNRRKDD
jgi:hypothetical protein